jgi:RNA polymerase sigma factor (sigma-70 family)
MTANTTIFLVDDDPAVRDALAVFLEGSGFRVSQFDSAEAFLANTRGTSDGVLVLDQRMGGMSGLELQEELKARNIELPTIFITGHGDVQMSVTAMKEGAVDFLEKPFRNCDLLAGIEAAVARQETQRAHLARRAAADQCYQGLTPREREVMEYIVLGEPNRTIAERLGVSGRTVEVHRAKVMEKMRAGSLPDLVRLAALIGIGGAADD